MPAQRVGSTAITWHSWRRSLAGGTRGLRPQRSRAVRERNSLGSVQYGCRRRVLSSSCVETVACEWLIAMMVDSLGMTRGLCLSPESMVPGTV
jgi:hypothetical protein